MGIKSFLDEFKVERKVFERRTLFSIYKLMNKKILKSVESIVKEGKESVVCAGSDWKGKRIAIKIYRTLYCNFRNMWKYLIADPRFKRIRKDRFEVVKNWARREYKNLKKAFESKVNCPKPIFVHENILIMSFIGKNSPAPRLVDVELENPSKIYEKIVKEMEKLVKGRLIHADLSAYNILLHNQKPYLIDFSQAVTTAHPFAVEFLERDCKNINTYFERLGVEVEKELFIRLRGEMKL